MTIASQKFSGLVMAMVCAFYALGVLSPSVGRAESSVAVAFFHAPLDRHGDWVQDPYYGWVWYPQSRAAGWRPYAEGRWVYTAEYGWYWDSYEPWGWATYHYGRWIDTSNHGWVWVPDDEWGPGWAEWRYGGGYVGWEPMPPRRKNSAGASVSASADGNASAWIFVKEAAFVSGEIAARVPAARNTAVLAATVRATKYSSVNGNVVNRSLDITKLSASAKVDIKPVPITISEMPGAGAQAGGTGRIAIYRPVITAGADAKLKQSLDLDIPAVDLSGRLEGADPVVVDPGRAPSLGAGASGSVETGVGIGRGFEPGARGAGSLGGGLGVSGGGGLRLGR